MNDLNIFRFPACFDESDTDSVNVELDWVEALVQTSFGGRKTEMRSTCARSSKRLHWCERTFWVMWMSFRHTDWFEVLSPAGLGGYPQMITWIPVILDHENATAKIESVKTLYPVLYDYSYFREEYFWGKHTKITFWIKSLYPFQCDYSALTIIFRDLLRRKFVYTDNRLIRSRKCIYQNRVCKNAISTPLWL